MPEWYAATEDDPATVDRVTAAGAWPDAPAENLEVLGMLLEVARDQVWAFAPESIDRTDPAAPAPAPVPTDPPARLVYAQLQQAQNLWNASRVTSAGDTGGGEIFAFTPRPLDKTIRGIIRPVQGVPHVG
jgi:hypothetical protein